MMIELESGKLFANSTDTKGGLFTLQIIRQSQQQQQQTTTT
jgi:hypothetical protein